jgi:hypothetical protein
MSEERNPQLRSVTYAQSNPHFFEEETEEIKSINEEILVNKSRSSTLYSKVSEEQAKLEDFQTIKIIGQGSYGKVIKHQSLIIIGLFSQKLILER